MILNASKIIIQINGLNDYLNFVSVLSTVSWEDWWTYDGISGKALY